MTRTEKIELQGSISINSLLQRAIAIANAWDRGENVPSKELDRVEVDVRELRRVAAEQAAKPELRVVDGGCRRV